MGVFCAHRSGFSDLIYKMPPQHHIKTRLEKKKKKRKEWSLVGKGASIVLNKVPGYRRLIVLGFLKFPVSFLVPGSEMYLQIVEVKLFPSAC